MVDDDIDLATHVRTSESSWNLPLHPSVGWLTKKVQSDHDVGIFFRRDSGCA